MERQVKSINTVLMHVPEAYKDTVKLKNGIELYIDTRFDDVRHTIRYGTVVDSPDTKFQKGDTVYFHHNIVRRICSVEGNKIEGAESFLENIYQVEPDQIYGVKRNGVFSAVSPYCFIKPVPEDEKIIGNIKLVSKNTEKPQWGIVRYSNDQLREQGVEEGDTIIFTLDSEYEFPVDDEKLYRMKTSWIAAKICQ